MITINPLPPIEDKSKIDFSATLGVFSILLAFCSRQEQSIEQVYTLLKTAMHKERNFISLDSEQKPIGFIVWAKLPKECINRIRLNGYSTEGERLALLKSSTDKGEPTILFMLSPFSKHLDVIRLWQSTMGFEHCSCWVLDDKQHYSIRKLT